MNENPQIPLSGKWQRYRSYKQSGVEWLGEVPEEWGSKRLKFSADLINEKIFATNLGMPYIGLENIESWTGRYLPSEAPVEMEGLSNHFKAGDVLLGKLRPYLAKVFKTNAEGICTSELLVLHPKLVNQGFLFYYFISKDFITTIDSSTFGAKMPRANWDFIGNLPSLIPTSTEQIAIANFLDVETARIDALIEKKERIIALLVEKRAALISHAVTKGLDPDAKMKDSGVVWIGKVPEKWRVMRIAMAVQKITNGFVGPTRDILVDDGIRYLQSLHIKNGKILFNKPYYVSELWSLGHPKSILKEGDVLIVQTGDVGQCCTVTKEFENCNCHALIILRLKDGYGSGYYLSSLLRSDYGKNILNSIQEGALHPHLECGKVREVPVLLPPLKEQEKIMEYLEKKVSILDDMLTRITKSIDILQEYRSALISAAVTGKIDIRQEVTT